MEKYEITASRIVVAPEYKDVAEPTFEHSTTETATIYVMAEEHRQHIWSETELVGVSKSGVARLDRFFAEHPTSDGWRITVDATKYVPRLVGYSA